jgi:hypothetical protein
MILNLRLRYIFIIMLALIGIFLITAVEIVNSVDYPNSDFFSFWLAGRMVLTGQDPYSINEWIGGHHQFGSTWISDSQFLYPLPLAIFLAPLGLFSLYHAYIIWVVFLQSMIVLSVLLLFSVRADLQYKHYILPILAGIVLFRPTIITMLNGQLSGLLLLVSAFVIYFWEKEKWWQGSVLLPLLALKPNIGIPIIALLSIWLLVRRQIRMLGWIAISAFTLLFIGFVRDPHWISEYLSIGDTKLSQTFGYSPTVWGFAAYISGFKLNPTLVIGSLAAIVFLVGCLFTLLRKREFLSPMMVYGIVIVTSLLITPYSWSYDQVLLIIPIIVIMIEMMSRQYPYLLTASVFLLFDILTIVLLLVSAKIQMEVLNAIIPLSIYCILFIFILSMKSQKQLNSLEK